MMLFAFFVISNKLISSCLISIPFIKMLFLYLKLALITNSRFLTLLSNLITIALLTFVVKSFYSLYYDFGSLTPHDNRLNFVPSLTFRAYNICSTYVSFHLELSRIKGFLKQNSFPNLLSIRLFNLFLTEFF